MKRCVESAGGAGSSKRLERYPSTQNMQHFRPQMLSQLGQFTSASTRPRQPPQNMFCNKMSSVPYMYNNATLPWNFNGPPPPLPPPPPPPPPPPLRQPFLPRTAQTSLPVLGQVRPHLNQGPQEGKQTIRRTATHSQGQRVQQTVVNKKPKRKSMSFRSSARMWVREDAVKAISLEEEYSKKKSTAPILVLRFPDPELNRDTISKYSPDIVSVHFQQNSAPRYCFVHLREDADIDNTIATISKIPFGAGFVSAELKRIPPNPPSNPDDIDPYSLYVGNLPMAISTYTVKSYFPGALRVDVGFAQRMKCTRYAIVRYGSLEETMEAFRRSVNRLVDSRSLIVRFLRRTTTAVESIAKTGVDGDVSDSDSVTEANNSSLSSVNSVAVSRDGNQSIEPAFETPPSVEIPLDDMLLLLPGAVKHCQSRSENEPWGNTPFSRTAVKQEPFFKDENEESELINHLEYPIFEAQHFKEEIKVESNTISSKDEVNESGRLFCLGNDENISAIERYSCPNLSASVTPSPTSSIDCATIGGEAPLEAQPRNELRYGEIIPAVKLENDTESYEGIGSNGNENFRGQEVMTEITEEVTYISELYEQLHSAEGKKRSFGKNKTEADRLDELFSDVDSDDE